MTTTWTPELLRECRNRACVRLDRMSMAAAYLIGMTFADFPDEIEHYDESGWRPCKGRFAFFLVSNYAYRIRPTFNPLRSAVAGQETQHETQTQGATK